MPQLRQRGTAIVWLRRDLRLDDNTALFAAAESHDALACTFVLDPELLRGSRVGPPIVQFFFSSLAALRAELRESGSDLALLEGDAAHEIVALAGRLHASAVYFARDDDSDALARDERVGSALRAAGIAVHTVSDQVYYAADEIVQRDRTPYVVYTPYRRRWRERHASDPRPPLPSAARAVPKLLPAAQLAGFREVPAPEAYGHASSAAYPAGGGAEAHRLLRTFLAHADRYATERNIPAIEGTSRLSPHLRAGTIGIRTVVAAASDHDAWLGELIWRDFYHQLLGHRPKLAREPFIAAAADIPYRDDEDAFAAWCAGRTGYPIVDAAMRQLNATGWMHNRVRMITASFLTKHLLIDYRAGERYFEQRLADADLAANNGGWQWSASVGTDAAPYFRVFNPSLQGKTYDPGGAFVRRMIPALRDVPARFVHEPWTMPPLVAAAAGCRIGVDYPAPIVDHAIARARAIAVFGAALAKRKAPGLSSP